MSRVLLLDMSMTSATDEFARLKIGVSALEPLTSGGIRLVCMSSHGAATARRKLKAKLIAGEVVRTKLRPRSPLW